MKRLYCTLSSTTPLLIIPNVISHLDGHPVLAQTYHVFFNRGEDSNDLLEPEGNIPDEHDHPDYYGKITFENADQLFTYYHGNNRLTRSEVAEVINCIQHMRANPHLWKTGI